MELKRATRAEVAEIFGVYLRTLTNWEKDGMPRLRTGRFNLVAVAKWRTEQLNVKKPKETPESSEKDRQLASLRREQARTARLNRKKLEGSLVPADLATRVISECAVTVRNAIMGLGRRLAPRLVGMDAPQIEHTVNEETDGILRHLAKKGK